VALFPLAIPMFAGPGAIATVMVLMSRAAWEPFATASVFAAVTITCVASWLLMRYAAKVGEKIPKTLLRAFERIMGLLLAAVAVEFIAGGIRDMIGASP
jgi:multiple antibiotic resistance protein